MTLVVQFSCQSVDEMEPSRSERTGDLERDLERDGERELDGVLSFSSRVGSEEPV